MKYWVEGEMDLKGETRKFVKEIIAENEERAKEKALSQIGSNHGLVRSKIKISSVEKVVE